MTAEALLDAEERSERQERADPGAQAQVPTPADLVVVKDLGDTVVLSFPEEIPRFPPGLTESQRDVARRVFEGQSAREIAQARGSSPRTIGNQLESIYRKLGVTSRVELVLRLKG